MKTNIFCLGQRTVIMVFPILYKWVSEWVSEWVSKLVFSENQGVWVCAAANEREKYFLEKAAWMPCGHAATCLQWKH